MKKLQTKIITRELVTPDKLIEILEFDKESVKNISLIPPKLGQKNFGVFEVTYNSPIFAADTNFRRLSKNGSKRKSNTKRKSSFSSTPTAVSC